MGLDEYIISVMPLWLFRPVLLVAFICCALVGARIRRTGKKSNAEKDPESHILSAVLALLGLMIGFTFSMALSRYDERRELVVAEANAIGTAWLRAGLVEGNAGHSLRQSIAAYADTRARLPEKGATLTVEQQTGEQQRRLWDQMAATLDSVPGPIASNIVASFNDMFDAASARKAEREARIPSLVLEIVLLYSLLSAGIVGYVLGDDEARHRGVTFILFLLLTLSVALIIDLDRPWRGGITISQQPMIDMRAGLSRTD